MPETISQITIISDLLKRDPTYKEMVDQLEERLYNRYMVYLADKPKFNNKTEAISKTYLAQILSFKNTLELNKIAKEYKLSQEQRDGLPAILWKIFYREAEIKNLPQMLNNELKLGNISVAYPMAIEIANLYLPISDYLGDIPMVIKRWQYELPTEPAVSYKPSAISQPQVSVKPPVAAISQTTTVAPIMPPMPEILSKKPPTPNVQPPTNEPISPQATPLVPPIRPRSTIIEQHLIEKDKTAPTKHRQTKSPDVSASQNKGNQTHPSNIINLKNF